MPFSRSVIQHTRICSCIQSDQSPPSTPTRLWSPSQSNPSVVAAHRGSFSPHPGTICPPQEPLTFCVSLLYSLRTPWEGGFKLLREIQFSYNAFFHSGSDDSFRVLLKKIFHKDLRRGEKRGCEHVLKCSAILTSIPCTPSMTST